MALTVNTNVLSLNAQKNLNNSSSLLGQALERLSSGLRINSAKDDAAGLAIAERLTTQIRGLNQAVRNANDGISLSQTTEGALAEVASNLQRIRELAVQSANGTNSQADREALDAEVQQRLAEIDRIATQTTFNGLNVLDGTFGTATFQVGSEVGDTISLDLSTSIRSGDIGQIAQGTGNEVSDTAIGVGDLTINDVTVAASADFATSVDGQDETSAYAKAAAINNSGISGVTAKAIGPTLTATTAGGLNLQDDSDSFQLTLNGVVVLSETATASESVELSASQVAANINQFTDQTGVTASVNDSNTLEFTTADGRNITYEVTVNGTVAGGGETRFFDAVAETTERGTIELTSATGQIDIDDTVNSDDGRIGFGDTANILLDTTTLEDVDVTTVDDAEDAIFRVDAALATINATRGDLGAVQNRLESTIANLNNVVTNLEASRSRITDADFAAETAKLTKAQILQQAGVSVVSQANAAPQTVLGLLG